MKKSGEMYSEFGDRILRDTDIDSDASGVDSDDVRVANVE